MCSALDHVSEQVTKLNLSEVWLSVRYVVAICLHNTGLESLTLVSIYVATRNCY